MLACAATWTVELLAELDAERVHEALLLGVDQLGADGVGRRRPCRRPLDLGGQRGDGRRVGAGHGHQRDRAARQAVGVEARGHRGGEASEYAGVRRPVTVAGPGRRSDRVVVSGPAPRAMPVARARSTATSGTAYTRERITRAARGGVKLVDLVTQVERPLVAHLGRRDRRGDRDQPDQQHEVGVAGAELPGVEHRDGRGVDEPRPDLEAGDVAAAEPVAAAVEELLERAAEPDADDRACARGVGQQQGGVGGRRGGLHGHRAHADPLEPLGARAALGGRPAAR